MAQQVDAQQQSATIGRRYTGSALRHIAMPLGGIGTGQVSICGDGSLRQWELFNQSNHLGFIPDSFFAISASSGDESVTRVLQSREVLDLPDLHTPIVNDDHIPDQQRALVQRFQGVERTTFTGAYPFARVTYEDTALPLELTLEAYSPFVPTDVEASELPVVVFTFRLHNRTSQPVRGNLGATLKNVIGWDGVAPITGNLSPFFGGNVNRIVTTGDYTALVLENPSLPQDHPGHGQLTLAALDPGTMVMPCWHDAGAFIDRLRGAGDSAAAPNQGRYSNATPSAPGQTWNGGLAIPFDLAPDAAINLTILLAWSFPNRYVNFGQSGHHDDPSFTNSRLWLGNAYTTRFRNALDTIDHVITHRAALESTSRAWSDTLLTSSLPVWLSEFLAAQGALIRSPTTFRSDDGNFFGFEGTQGAPTSMLGWRPYGGSCPLNCTHVWNYEQALSRLFPSLERSMRDTDLDVMQAPEGFIPHRTIVPLTMRQLWDRLIGGPANPALDGMLGTVLKVYREVRQGASEQWRAHHWPQVKKLISYIERKWDPDNDGILDGEQPNTYDIAFYGPNMFIGSLWLAALRAGEELARLQDDTAEADRLHRRFVQASKAYDDLLWNGEYYVQIRDESAPPEQQYGPGCLSDQLVGQWWAHQLEIGYILPEDHVRTTLESILRHNYREGFHGWVPQEREFANDDDAGLFNLTWPHGGQPDVPTRYWDEVWTGTEYQVAAHCIMEGLVDDGLRLANAVRDRYSGANRNPYNDIECGDHYARAMSGWTILEALGGYRYDATSDALAFAPSASAEVRDDTGTFRAPFVTSAGWGQFEQNRNGRTRLTALHGEIRVATLTLRPGAGKAVIVNGAPVDVTTTQEGDKITIRFAKPFTLASGDVLDTGE